MTLWDFFGKAFYLLGEWVAYNWPWLAALAFCIVICVIGWLLSEKNVQPEKHPYLSERDIDRLNAWNNHGTRTLPPSLFPKWYKAEDEAEMIVESVLSEYETEERGEL